MSKSDETLTIDGWTYDSLDGALTVERKADLLCGGFAMVGRRGELLVSVDSGRGMGPNCSIPASAVVALIRDGVARGVLTLDAAKPAGARRPCKGWQTAGMRSVLVLAAPGEDQSVTALVYYDRPGMYWYGLQASSGKGRSVRRAHLIGAWADSLVAAQLAAEDAARSLLLGALRALDDVPESAACATGRRG